MCQKKKMILGMYHTEKKKNCALTQCPKAFLLSLVKHSFMIIVNQVGWIKHIHSAQ